jgi:CRISPR-associated protein Csn2
MKINFDGFDHSIYVDSQSVHVLEILNHTLFARVCTSLLHEEGVLAVEPYTLWDNDKEVKPRGAFLVVENPLDLPWGDRKLSGALLSRFEKSVVEDGDLHEELIGYAACLERALENAALSFQSDYTFGVEWDVGKFLKAFQFGIDVSPDDSLLDSLIKFLELVSDSLLSKPIVFINLKLFLSENDLEELYRQAIFLNLELLLVEASRDAYTHRLEKKLTIDQHLLEF